MQELKALVNDIPDFPKPGILFRDITPLLRNRFDELLGALGALLDGAAEADGFNRLVLRAGLDWRECWLLRAMFRWAKQVGFPFAQASVEAALAAHPEAARLLVEIFQTV